MSAPSPLPPLSPRGNLLDSAVQIIGQLGIPTVFACVLLWFVLTNVSATLEHIEASETKRTELVAAIHKAFLEGLDRNLEQNKKILEELQVIGRERRAPSPPGP